MNQNDWINLLSQKRTSQPTGIVFGASRFSEPVLFPLFLPPTSAGIYAILVPDSTTSPRPFRVIYFGQAQELNERVGREHEKYPSWLAQAGGEWTLYASYHLVSGDESARTALEKTLIQQYQPACNDIHNRLASLAQVPRAFGRRS